MPVIISTYKQETNKQKKQVEYKIDNVINAMKYWSLRIPTAMIEHRDS